MKLVSKDGPEILKRIQTRTGGLSNGQLGLSLGCRHRKEFLVISEDRARQCFASKLCLLLSRRVVKRGSVVVRVSSGVPSASASSSAMSLESWDRPASGPAPTVS